MNPMRLFLSFRNAQPQVLRALNGKRPLHSLAMRIIQLDETQTDISTQAHFHPLAIRLYGQHGINAAGPTGSEVRQASPPPPKPLLSPFIPPSSSSSTAPHSYPSHTHTHTHKPAAPVNNKPPDQCLRILAKSKSSQRDEGKKVLITQFQGFFFHCA